MQSFPFLSFAVMFMACSFPVVGQLVSDGGTKVITGTTSNVNGDLNVGVSGSGTKLIITNGGVVTVSGNSTLGVNASSSSNLVQVAGAASRWLTAGDLSVGLAGNGNQIRAESGGFIGTTDCYIGADGNANGAVVTSGAVWTNATALFVGENGAQNTALVSDGGVISSETGWLGFSITSISNIVRVTGAGSVWSNSDSFFVGYNGFGCQLVLSNGAVLQDLLGFIGRNPGSSNNLAVVTGPNTAWRTDQAFFVGDGSAGNRLVVSNGASILVGTNLVIGTIPFATNNQIRIENANVIVTNSGHTASLEVRRGTNLFNGGLLDVDQLLLPNPGAAFVFNAGELRLTQSQVSNSAPFIVGNGSSPAVLQLRGGTNTFVNGLIISSNATLIGCGTINASVVNYGTILSTCPGGTLTFGGAVTNYSSIAVTNGGQLQFLGPVVNFGSIITTAAEPPVLSSPRFVSPDGLTKSFRFDFLSQQSVSYFVEFKTQLQAAVWSPLTNFQGNGGVYTVIDNAPDRTSRFYRVRVQ